ncbi:hypothetical protein POM88_012862 [Heracleum sosnowskyi]|uniref:FAD-binding PCMH-type domain-containing protein n=1 Tax=Heracleum sosnowskyi TaxID=360622 RepID=A0AAD8IZU9_9APIA|nr:hypothetical protein POM88_012862 [Heracleum sosnowskyi]
MSTNKEDDAENDRMNEMIEDVEELLVHQPKILENLVDDSKKLLYPGCNDQFTSKVFDPMTLDKLQVDIIVTLCEFEIFLCILKAYMRNRRLPEASIVEGYSVEETIEFCTEYLTSANPIGIPRSRLEGQEVNPYFQEHITDIRRMHHSKSGKWVTNEHNRSFVKWFKDRVMSRYSESPSTISNTLKWLAYGPDMPVISYQGYDVNGYSFYTQCQDNKSTVQNSGVSVEASSTEFERGNSLTSRDIKKSYYRVIEEIWELDYKDFKVALFKCKWCDIKRGVRVDESGFILVDFSRFGYEDDSFIFATQVKQVFYIRDPADTRWSIVLQSKRRILGIDNVEDEEEYNQFDENPHFSIGLPTTVREDNVEHVVIMMKGKGLIIKARRNNRKEFLWYHTEVQCPQQEGGTECGFYVMRYMYDIVMISQKNPNINWKKGLGSRTLLDDNGTAEGFLKCLDQFPNNISSLVYTQQNSTFNPTLLYSINNMRFAKPETPKPLVIVTPVSESQVQSVIYCCKDQNLEMRIRSGGHSFEGLSYVSSVPFVLLDLVNFKTFSFDAATGTALAGSGLTNGELYYNIGKQSDVLGFPSGLWANVGVGGIISGGGYGMMRRKYGLAADNVVDARLIDANGRILNRTLMGEDWFWAIRGGGGGSFGVVLSWNVSLVPVPKIVTVFKVYRSLEQNLTNIFYRFQSVAPKFPKELDIRANGQSIVSGASPRKDNRTMMFQFESLYLGGVDNMLSAMAENFPELGVVREDCFEASWLQAMVYFSNFELRTPPEILLDSTVLPRPAFKSRNDYTQVPIPVQGLEGLWEMMYEIPPQQATLQFTPYGGRMDEISESALPFPHRAGTLYKFNMFVQTHKDEDERIEWIRNLGTYLTPYVSQNPRSAYVNYVDLWMGTNNLNGTTSYQQASGWGKRYFKNNFDRLVKIKTVVDPTNFFRHEQSIPVIST